MGKEKTRSKEVDAYIFAQPEETQRALEELRSCIWLAAPNVSELLNYNIPAFALVEGGKRDQQVMMTQKGTDLFSTIITLKSRDRL